MNWKELLCEKRLGRTNDFRDSFFDSPFERDYYTIISSSHFRRLQGKTQVFTLEPNDFVRNRLTHSIEVSSICENLGRKIAKYLTEESAPDGVNVEEWQKGHDDIADYQGENSPGKFEKNLTMVLRCSGLLHDIGNPPFGHSGEKYIRDFFEEKLPKIYDGQVNENSEMKYDLINFEGNAQNIRIATRLGKGSIEDYPNHGFALTIAVLGSLIKYPYSSDKLDDPKAKEGKYGFTRAESYYFNQITTFNGTRIEPNKAKKNPIMYLMEAADDIAYGTADIEDFLSMDMIEFEEVSERLEITDSRPYIDDKDKLRMQFLRIREKSIDEAAKGFINNYSDIMMGNCDKEWDLVQTCSFDFKFFKDRRKTIYITRDTKNEICNHAKTNMFYIMDNLINISKKDISNRSFGEGIVFSDFEESYYKRAINDAKEYATNNSTDVELEKKYFTLLAVADYVSGMTDQYVEEFAKKIYCCLNEKNNENEVKQSLLYKIVSTREYSTVQKSLYEIQRYNISLNEEDWHYLIDQYLYREDFLLVNINDAGIRISYKNEIKRFLRLSRRYKDTDFICGIIDDSLEWDENDKHELRDIFNYNDQIYKVYEYDGSYLNAKSFFNTILE